MQRTDLLDTSDAAWRLLLARLREMTPEQRLLKAFEMSEEARDFRKRTEHLRPQKPNP
jgi:hypothetical protein